MGGSASYRQAKKVGNTSGTPKPKTFRDKVKDAQTQQDLLSALQEQYGAQNVAKGFVMKHDLEMTKRAVDTVLELEERYPFMKGAINGFHNVVDPSVVFDPNGSIAAQTETSFNPMTGEAHQTFGLGAAYATKDNPILFTGNSRGKDIPNMTPESVVAHEFGHAVHNYLLGRMLQDARKKGLMNALMMADDIKKNITLQRLEKQAKQSIGYKKALPYFRGEISGYASGAKSYGGNPTRESFAEAFADVFANGSNASKVSKAYVDTLVNEINRLGYGG